MPRRLILVAASLAFVATVYFANWLVKHYGPIRVWPTDLYAPAGVYVVGLAFLLRDTIQRFAGQLIALALIAVGTLLSMWVSTGLALASGAAFAASEILGLAIFWALGGNYRGRAGLAAAVVCASAAAAAVDSFVFLTLAPTLVPGVDNLHFFRGQFVAKVSVLAVAVPFVLVARRRWPNTPIPQPVAVPDGRA